MMFFAITWESFFGCISATSSSSRTMLRNINSTLTWYTTYCNITCYFPALRSPCSSNYEFLFRGYIIDKNGVHMGPEKINVIRGWPALTSVHEVDQFIGLCGFQQQFLEGFQAGAAPLTAMFKADLEWDWTAIHTATFDKLKQAMITAAHLSGIDPDKRTICTRMLRRIAQGLR